MSIRIVVDAAPTDAAALSRAVALVAAGGVVAYPTDTFYGLAADPRLSSAVTQIFAIKGRDAARAIPLIAADMRQVRGIAGELDGIAARLASEFWPGPLTLVVRAVTPLAPDLLAGGDTVAVRVPAHRVARELAAAVGVPITSTSANMTGAAPALTADDVLAQIGPRIDAVLDAGPCGGGLPSTIVDVTGGEPRLVRAGAVPWTRVLQSLLK